jgi:glycosyltransferase involved in cell wall biosynthesis
MGAGVRRTRLVAAARILERYAWTRVAALIVVHRELSDWIVANLPVDRARIHVIPNGVDAARFRPDHEARSLVRRRLGLPEDAFLAISMKSLHKDDLPTVLRAVAAIDEPRFRLLVPWRDATSSLPKIVGEAGARNVIVVPKIPYAEMAGYYSAADLVIVPYLKKEYGVAATEPDGRTEPSLREACRAGYASVTSLAAMEALASGTPTIVSVPGATGSPSPSDIGTAVRAWDHRALADAVQAMIDDPSAAKAMAENARRFVGEEFSWERIAERTVKAYRRAAG